MDINSINTDPIPLEHAIKVVDSWGPEMHFGLHELAKALRKGVAEAQAETIAIKKLGSTLAHHERALLTRERDEYIAKAYELAEAEERAWKEGEEWMLRAYRLMEELRVTKMLFRFVQQREYALRPLGEKIEINHLAESGELHLFHPAKGNEPLKSAGCVKLIEPK